MPGDEDRFGGSAGQTVAEGRAAEEEVERVIDGLFDIQRGINGVITERSSEYVTSWALRSSLLSRTGCGLSAPRFRVMLRFDRHAGSTPIGMLTH